MTRFETCLPLILAHEGGYDDDPADNGGATNLGVTIGTLSDWLGHPATKAQVKALTPATVAPIYERNYWQAASCDKLPAGVDYIVFDMAVLSGVKRAKRYLQRGLGAVEDGIIGPRTLAAARAAEPQRLISSINNARENFYRGLPDFPHFGKGWIRRCEEVKVKALQIAAVP